MNEHRDWLLIEAADPVYADRVVANLTIIVGTAAGRALLRRLRASGRLFRIEPPAPTDPPNAWVRFAAEGMDCLIACDPADWPSPIDPSSPAADAVLFALLEAACRQVEGGGPALAAESAAPLYRSAALSDYARERGNG